MIFKNPLHEITFMYYQYVFKRKQSKNRQVKRYRDKRDKYSRDNTDLANKS